MPLGNGGGTNATTTQRGEDCTRGRNVVSRYVTKERKYVAKTSRTIILRTPIFPNAVQFLEAKLPVSVLDPSGQRQGLSNVKTPFLARRVVLREERVMLEARSCGGGSGESSTAVDPSTPTYLAPPTRGAPPRQHYTRYTAFLLVHNTSSWL